VPDNADAANQGGSHEDNTSTPHLQIRVLEPSGQPWRIAVNV
jgi:hypothetical protein